MDWRIKLAGHWAVSILPKSDALGYRLQRHVTRSLPLPEASFQDHMAVARWHATQATKYLGRTPESVFEFGAGWDLVIPLTLSTAGVANQTVTDVRRLLRNDLLADTARRLGVSADLEARGIRYLAPIDARATGLPPSQFDLAMSTDTIEHIPASHLVAVLTECRRLLRGGGILTARIDYTDHFSHADARLGPFHFLRYGTPAWRWRNPMSHYQSRLRHRDILAAMDAAGFDIVDDEPHHPRVDLLDGVHREFAAYSPEELAVSQARVVARAREA